MGFIYNCIVFLASFALTIIALFNKKIRFFVDGRKGVYRQLARFKKGDAIVWIHAASLGEFEQGRPVIEKIKEQYPQYKILLTFFYE